MEARFVNEIKKEETAGKIEAKAAQEKLAQLLTDTDAILAEHAGDYKKMSE
jgi:hypothetical protein